MDAIGNQKSLPELVYGRLVEAISDGTLPPGRRLTQEGIAGQLDVSRLPVHQALKRLQAEGFVRPAGRRGLEVAPLEPTFVRELYEFRAGIDQVAAGLAARVADATTRARGEAVVARGHEAAAAHDLRALIEADMAFHQLVYELAGNTMILDTMASHWHHTRRVMQHILGDHRNQAQVWRDHQAILEAICTGEPEAAEREARAHVERAAAWFEHEVGQAAAAD
ncbi:MAG: GntR family transcriptional regulator [Halofilum sp. (in: g-proteobacteria)]|nr:GntR family transcriptional regulator [Halofilum sp. (in: g-proteobacteria)]